MGYKIEDITEEEFNLYRDMRSSGVGDNLSQVNTASEIIGLRKEKIFTIKQNYDVLANKYAQKRKESS